MASIVNMMGINDRNWTLSLNFDRIKAVLLLYSRGLQFLIDASNFRDLCAYNCILTPVQSIGSAVSKEYPVIGDIDIADDVQYAIQVYLKDNAVDESTTIPEWGLPMSMTVDSMQKFTGKSFTVSSQRYTFQLVAREMNVSASQ